MLVLSRRQSETVTIGDEIEIQVVSIRGGRVKLGVTAPQRVHVRREELTSVLEVHPATTERQPSLDVCIPTENMP